MLFHLSWNIIPDDMEQDSILAVTKRVTKKHCLRVKTVLLGSIAFKACYTLSPHGKEERGYDRYSILSAFQFVILLLNAPA